MKISVCCPSVCKGFRLFPHLLNSISRKKRDLKIYRWLWWNWCVLYKKDFWGLLGELLEACKEIDNFFYSGYKQTWRGDKNMKGLLKHAYKIHVVLAKIKSRR